VGHRGRVREALGMSDDDDGGEEEEEDEEA